MKKIVLFIDSYPPRAGGMETHAYEFAKFLLTQKILEFKGVIAFGNSSTPVSAETFPVTPTILPDAAITDSSLVIDTLNQWGIGSGDILFFNTLYWIEILTELRAAFPETQFVQRSGGNDLMQAPIDHAGATLAERREYVCNVLNNTLSFLVVTSEYSKKRFKHLGIRDDLMQVVVGGVDTQRFVPLHHAEKYALRTRLNIPSDSTVILDVARLVPFKGIEYELKSLQLLSASIQNAHWVFVGDGPYMNTYRELCNQLNLTHIVTFAGEVPPGVIHEYYQVADIFCHTPVRFRQTVRGGSYIHTESMGRCLLEASASGLPAVVSDVGGIREVIRDGVSGLVIPARKPAESAKKLELLCRDMNLRKQLGLQGRELVQAEFSWHDVFAKYVNLFT